MIGAISKEKVETEKRGTEESNQRFKDEWTKCSKMQWQSNKRKISLQQQTRVWDPGKMKIGGS